ncbi:MAG TPA: PhzF family phenazine biosynthesis protein [Solirubrobacteraceae bacterium]|nr:PhzF family phenazine biosynthesis protein [Solirubrobacteraceae bacterium]
MTRPFAQVDVFGDGPMLGNPVAVVLDGSGLDDDAMRLLARWTNLSETTFVLPAQSPAADYRVRIFTPQAELPFAGHPTLGTCHAWLEHGGRPAADDVIVQECAAGLIPIRRIEPGLAFSAPPLVRSGPVEPALVTRIAAMLGIDAAEIVDSQWVDNGPGWVAVLLADAQAVLDLRPGTVDLDVGVVGAHEADHDASFEVRAFFPVDGATREDPVTGSLNASLAGWLLSSGRATAPYTAAQGTALHRRGRVHVSVDGDGAIWVAGTTSTAIAGTLEL